jgi:hypothetical protein
MADAGDVARMRAIGARLTSWDVQIRWMPGWETSGATWIRVPVGIVDHHDGSSIKSGEWGALGVIIAGRPDVPPRLSQFQVARCLDDVPKLAICAAGRANHAGRGSWRFPDGLVVPTDSGNSWLYGAEKAHSGGPNEAITDAANYAADALFRAVLEVCG